MNRQHFRYLSILICALISLITAKAEIYDYAPRVAIVDLNGSQGTKENERRLLYSTMEIVKTSGLPYHIVTKFSDAVNDGAQIIIMTHHVTKEGIMPDNQIVNLTDWVMNGGILIAPAIEKDFEKINTLFGLSTVGAKVNTHSQFIWTSDTAKVYPELSYFNSDGEKKVLMPQETSTKHYETMSYVPDAKSTVLAYWKEDSTAAVVKHTIGKGSTYTFGVRWPDMIQRVQLQQHKNKFSANDTHISSDAYALFMRACFENATPLNVWKNTVPGANRSTLVVLEDYDTPDAIGYDERNSDFWLSKDIEPQVFITTRYFELDKDYPILYTDQNVDLIRKNSGARGFKIGSHTVTHASDMNNSRFGYKQPTKEEYENALSRDGSKTLGGSIWAEANISKQILETDLGPIKSFSAADLPVHKSLARMLHEAGYENASLYGVNESFTQFPYFMRDSLMIDELNNILHLPISFSDATASKESEVNNCLAMWSKISKQLYDNHAPQFMYVHPNESWKLEMYGKFIDSLPKDCGRTTYEDYAEFWRTRSDANFEYDYDAETYNMYLTVWMEENNGNDFSGLSLYVDKKDCTIDNIYVKDRVGNDLKHHVIDIDSTTACVILDPTKLELVEASQSSARVERGVKIALSNPHGGASIYYTLDGTIPTSKSTLYEGPIQIKDNTQIRAIAVYPGLIQSDISAFDYTIPYKVGDANGDDDLTLADVSMTTLYIVGEEMEGFVFNAADINLDEDISVSDATAIVDIVLDYPIASASLLASSYANNTESNLFATDVTTESFDINLNSANMYFGMQFDIVMPEGTRIEGLALADDNAKTHTLAYRALADSRTRVMIYSLVANDFKAEDIVRVYYTFDDKQQDSYREVVVGNALLDYIDESGRLNETSDPGLVIPLPNNSTTVNQEMQNNALKIYAIGHTLHIDATDSTVLPLISIDGTYRMLDVKAGKNTYHITAKGFYMVGSEKIIIK